LRINSNVVVSGALGYGLEMKQVGGRVGVQLAW
jgi:hypothetical protein